MNMRSIVLFVIIALASVSSHAQSWRLLIPVQAYTVQVNRYDPSKLYIGNWSNQLYRSYDGGNSWEVKEVGSVGPQNFLTSVVVSTVDTNIIISGGLLTNGIRRSTDGGNTWKQVLIDAGGRRQWFVSEAITEVPKEPTTLYAARGATNNAIYKSTDTGATWDSISVVDPSLTTRLCTIAARPDSANILFLGCKLGVILRSDDHGITWRRVPVANGLDSIRPDSEIPKIIFSQRDPKVGYAIVAIAVEDYIDGNGGVLKTTDGGATWDQIAYVDTSFWAVEARPTPDGLNDEVFIGGFRTSDLDTVIKGDSLVYRSPDGGTSWSRMENIHWEPNERGDTNRNVWSLRYDSVGKKMYMATFVGLYVLDEISSVNDNLTGINTSSLHLASAQDVVTVTDDEAFVAGTEWAVYTMSGTRLAGGSVTNDSPVSINTASFAQGRYLLTWGTRERFRTALFTILR